MDCKLIDKCQSIECQDIYIALEYSISYSFLASTSLYAPEKEWNDFLKKYLSYWVDVLNKVPDINKVFIREKLFEYFKNFIELKNPEYKPAQECLKKQLCEYWEALQLTLNGQPFYWSCTTTSKTTTPKTTTELPTTTTEEPTSTTEDTSTSSVFTAQSSTFQDITSIEEITSTTEVTSTRPVFTARSSTSTILAEESTTQDSSTEEVTGGSIAVKLQRTANLDSNVVFSNNMEKEIVPSTDQKFLAKTITGPIGVFLALLAFLGFAVARKRQSGVYRVGEKEDLISKNNSLSNSFSEIKMNSLTSKDASFIVDMQDKEENKF